MTDQDQEDLRREWERLRGEGLPRGHVLSSAGLCPSSAEGEAEYSSDRYQPVDKPGQWTVGKKCLFIQGKIAHGVSMTTKLKHKYTSKLKKNTTT